MALSKPDEGFVFKGSEYAGRLVKTPHGARFDYDKNFLANNKHSLSFRIPRYEPSISFTGMGIHPFFANLLPEGVRLNALVRTLKTSADDLFTLLLSTGPDTAGDVCVLSTPEFAPPKPKNLSSKKLSFNKLFEESLSGLLSLRGTDATLPGIHPKISGAMLSLPIQASKQKRGRSYILKLAASNYPKLVENEFFFMNAARNCGIETAPVEILTDQENVSGLLVERFDRVFDRASKTSRKLHTEDGCQLLNIFPSEKYRVSISDLAGGIMEYATAPIVEITKLIRLHAYCYVIGNGDFHAKNISLLVQSPHEIVFSPAYDLVSTLPYGDQSMALQFEGRKDNFKRKDFAAFGKRYHVPEKVVFRILDEVCEGIKPSLNEVGAMGFDKKKTDFLKSTISKRIQGLR